MSSAALATPAKKKCCNGWVDSTKSPHLERIQTTLGKIEASYSLVESRGFRIGELTGFNSS